MSVKLEFIDTNILIYAFDPSDPQKHKLAKQLLERLWLEQTGCLSIQVMQEFFVNATRKIAQPLSILVASQILKDYSEWIVHSPNPMTVITATQLLQKTNISFWDALLVTSATELSCRILWSEDLNNGQKYGLLQVLNPFDNLSN